MKRSNKYDHLQEILREVLLIANNNRLNLELFTNVFLNSKEFDEVLTLNEDYYFNPHKVYYDFIEKHKIEKQRNKISNDIVIYIAFIYSKFLNRTKESINKILKILPVDKIINNYDLFHTLSEEVVIFNAKYEYNIKMNPIRKQRSKYNVAFNFSKNDFNLFIAKQLYKKLFNYPEIKELNYRYNDFPYLITDNLLIVSTTINSIKEIYNAIHNGIYDSLKFNISNTVLFIFSNNEIDSKTEIKSLLIDKVNCAIPFDKVLIFDNNKIIFSNISIPSKTFYLDINSKDIKDINIEYKNRYNN